MDVFNGYISHPFVTCLSLLIARNQRRNSSSSGEEECSVLCTLSAAATLLDGEVYQQAKQNQIDLLLANGNFRYDFLLLPKYA